MQKLKIKNISGFTLIEFLIVLGILLMLISIAVSSLSKAGGSEALDTTTMSLVSILNGAKSSAVSSKDASDYGIRILNNKIISFKNSYGIENSEYVVSDLVILSTSTGLGADIIFNNVSGSTNASGTITVRVLNNQSQYNTIRVYPTGVIEKN